MSAVDDWPFSSFSREDYDRLTAYQKAMVRSEFARLVRKATKDKMRTERPSYLQLVVDNDSA